LTLFWDSDNSAIVLIKNIPFCDLLNRYFPRIKKKSALEADVFLFFFLTDICLLYDVIYYFYRKRRKMKLNSGFMNSGRKKLFFVFSLCQAEKKFRTDFFFKLIFVAGYFEQITSTALLS